MYIQVESDGIMNYKGWESRIRQNIHNISILSTARSETPCGNPAAPSAKAKYSWETDSEPVPWGKGEKNLEQRSEIEPETVCLQAVGVP